MYYKILVPGSEPGTYNSCHGGNHTWTPGVTYGPVPVKLCYTGFHACRLQDLSTWLTDGMVVFEVELTGVVESGDKVVGSTATLGRHLGTLTLWGMAEFARRCAVRAQRYAVHAERYAAAAGYAAAAAGYADAAAAAAAAVYADAAAAAAAAGYAAAAAGYAAGYASRNEREQQGRDILSLLVP